MDSVEILNNLLIYSGLNIKSLSEKIGLDRPQALYDIQKGKTKAFSQAMSIKIVSVFPTINKSWLLTGEGEMLKPNTSIHNTGVMDTSGNSNKIHNTHSNNSSLEDKAEIKRLKEIITEKNNLIDEKERLIVEKERMISFLINQPKPLP